jgi:UDP-2-acetamido-2-deoxy-ribo-hexuluronate aminotransferase
MLYYPVPVHRQKMFDASGKTDLQLPVTDWLTGRVISLPMHTELDEEQLAYITKNVSDFVHR